jgi:hypothetical protein
MIEDKEILNFCIETLYEINIRLEDIISRMDELGNITNYDKLRKIKQSNKIRFSFSFRYENPNKIWKLLSSDNIDNIKQIFDYISPNIIYVPKYKFPKISIETNDTYTGMIDTYGGVDYQIPYIVYVNITLIKK